MRAEDLGSNPHSKGDSFSRSMLDRADSSKAVTRIAVGKIAAIIIERVLNSIHQE